MNYLVTRQWGLLAAALTLMLDAVTKGWVLTHQDSLPIEVIPGLFAIVLAWNRGMSFSFLSDVGDWGPWLLGGLAVAACIWFVHWMGAAGSPKGGHGKWLHPLGLGLVTGGAIGNVLDRVQHGAVVDFLLVYWGEHYFPVFNPADTAITLGVMVLLWDSVRQTRMERRQVAASRTVDVSRP